ncbi:MAG: hypothetical protein Q9166_002660 [cf. Caloplaca sp. 2 TL-2023]
MACNHLADNGNPMQQGEKNGGLDIRNPGFIDHKLKLEKALNHQEEVEKAGMSTPDLIDPLSDHGNTNKLSLSPPESALGESEEYGRFLLMTHSVDDLISSLDEHAENSRLEQMADNLDIIDTISDYDESQTQRVLHSSLIDSLNEDEENWDMEQIHRTRQDLESVEFPSEEEDDESQQTHNIHLSDSKCNDDFSYLSNNNEEGKEIHQPAIDQNHVDATNEQGKKENPTDLDSDSEAGGDSSNSKSENDSSCPFCNDEDNEKPHRRLRNSDIATDLIQQEKRRNLNERFRIR